jgi:hydroxymethylglutaryl-CoA lyase
VGRLDFGTNLWETVMSEKIALREVGMRDGLQSIATVMPTATKIAWLDAEYAAGVRYVEVSSFVPPKLLPQLADAEVVIAHAMTLAGLHVSALIPNSRGAERGIALGVPEMNYVLSVSNGHNLSNVRRPTEESIADFRRVVALCHAGDKPARINCGLATSFGCTIEGDVDEDRVRRIANEIAAAGADGIILADTVGYGQPAAIERVFRKVIADVAPLPVAAHFHDTRGLGLANVLAAYNAGCREFDASLGGLGGCPYAPGATGNIVMEDTAFLFESMGCDTGIDLDRLVEVRAIVAKALPEVTLYGAIAKAGLPRNFHPVAQAAE